MNTKAVKNNPLTHEELEILVRFAQLFGELSRNEKKPLQQQEPLKKKISK